MNECIVTKKKKSLILWAVDPFQDPKDSKNLVKELELWSTKLNCQVQPVAVFSKFSPFMPKTMSKSAGNDFELNASEIMAQYLERVGAQDFLPAKALTVSHISHRQWAVALGKLAKRSRALLIFANTRAVNTWNPLRLGGFAETLIATSPVPVLLLNPKAAATKEINSILFPTDFGSNSKNAMERLSPWIKEFNSKVFLFNQVETPFPEAYDIKATKIEPMLQSLHRRRDKIAESWSNNLSKNSIRNSYFVLRQKNYLGSDITQMALKKNADLITLTTEGGPVAQTFLGSVARDVIFNAECPVLVFHQPKSINKPQLKLKCE